VDAAPQSGVSANTTAVDEAELESVTPTFDSAVAMPLSSIPSAVANHEAELPLTAEAPVGILELSQAAVTQEEPERPAVLMVLELRVNPTQEEPALEPSQAAATPPVPTDTIPSAVANPEPVESEPPAPELVVPDPSPAAAPEPEGLSSAADLLPAVEASPAAPGTVESLHESHAPAQWDEAELAAGRARLLASVEGPEKLEQVLASVEFYTAALGERDPFVEATVLRFLVTHKWNVKSAHRHLASTAKWRNTPYGGKSAEMPAGLRRWYLSGHKPCEVERLRTFWKVLPFALEHGRTHEGNVLVICSLGQADVRHAAHPHIRCPSQDIAIANIVRCMAYKR